MRSDLIQVLKVLLDRPEFQARARSVMRFVRRIEQSLEDGARDELEGRGELGS